MLPLYIYFSIILIGIALGVLKFRHLALASRLILILLVYVFLKEITANLIAIQFSFNLSFYKFLSPVDFLLTVLVFWFIPLMKGFRKRLLIVSLLIVGFYLINLFLWQRPGKGVDSNFKMVRSFFLLYFSLALFFQLIKYHDMESVFRKSAFWFAAGILIFYTVNIFYWGVYNYYLGNTQIIMREILRPAFEMANYILYSCFTIVIWLNNFTLDKAKSTYVGR